MPTSRDLDTLVDEPCWCGATDVKVSRRVQIKGGTKSCGRFDCRPERPTPSPRDSEPSKPKRSDHEVRPKRLGAAKTRTEGPSHIIAVRISEDEYQAYRGWCEANEYNVAQHVRALIRAHMKAVI